MQMKATSSKGSERGTSIDSRTGIAAQHWSGNEHSLGWVLRADPTVAEVWTQEPTVKYRNAEGEWTTHRWDCRALLVDGSTVVYNVKPLHEIELVRSLFKLLVAQGHPHGYADHMRCVSDTMLSFERVANARERVRSRENHNRADYLEALGLLPGRHGKVLFDDLFKGASNEGDRRVALFRLIDKRVLVPCGGLHERIERYTFVTVDHNQLQEEVAANAGYRP